MFRKMDPNISILAISREKYEFRLVNKRISESSIKGIINGFKEKYLVEKMLRENQYTKVIHNIELNIFTEINEKSIMHR